MTTTLFRKLAPVAAVLAWLAAPAHAQAPAASGCATTVASLNGSYGMLISAGTLPSGGGTINGPKFLVGAVAFNGAGNFTGSNVYSGAASTTASGTYTVNSDCTIQINLTLGSGPANTYTVAMDGTGSAMGIETDAAGVGQIAFKPQSSTAASTANFTNASLNGTFAANCIGPHAGTSDLNLQTFSGGKVSGTDPFNDSGTTVVANNPYTGTYTVNSDGTFAGTDSAGSATFNFYGVLAMSNTEILYIYSNPAANAPTGTGIGFESCDGGLTSASTAAAAPFSLSPASSPLTLQQNMGGTDNIVVTPSAGFTGSVSLAVSGAPAGVGTAFVGNLLVVIPPLTTPTGSYPLTITGTSGGSTATTTVSLVITPGASFTLNPASSGVTITRGKSGTDGITVAPVNGFSGAVSFTVSGLPAGVTATFSPASSSAGSTLGLTVSPNAAVGTYPLTVTGASAATGNSNSVVATAKISLTVQ